MFFFRVFFVLALALGFNSAAVVTVTTTTTLPVVYKTSVVYSTVAPTTCTSTSTSTSTSTNVPTVTATVTTTAPPVTVTATVTESIAPSCSAKPTSTLTVTSTHTQTTVLPVPTITASSTVTSITTVTSTLAPSTVTTTLSPTNSVTVTTTLSTSSTTTTATSITSTTSSTTLAPSVTTTTTTNTPTPSSLIRMVNGGDFVQLVVGEEEFKNWNNINDGNYANRMRNGAKELFKLFKDEFDFIFFVINNEATPPPNPTGVFLHVKNTVDGLAIDTKLDQSAAYGSSGYLQGTSTLWRRYLNYGPIFHEMGHRWFNFGASTPYPSHWREFGTGGTNPGVYQSYENQFAEIELYLMGLIRSSEITNPVDRALYEEYRTKTPERNPLVGQNHFNCIIVLVSAQPVAGNVISETNQGIATISKPDMGVVSPNANFFRQTGGRATISFDQFTKSLK